MRRRMRRLHGLIGIGLLAAAGCGHPNATQRPVTVKVMILPEYSLNVMAARVAPLIARLQSALGPGYRVEWISCPSPEAFMATAERERPDVSMQDAFHTSWLMRLQGAEPMVYAEMPDGGAVTRGLVVAASGGEVRTLADLRGRRVAISSRRSYLGYLAQVSMLETAADIHAGSLRFVPVRWADRVGESMNRGRADAGFIAESDLQPNARVLARTESVPSGCVVDFPHTSATVAAAMKRALTELGAGNPDDAAILQGLGIRRFAPIDAPLRDRIARLAQNSPVPY